jgi:3',5'-cyclic AMP phosphodiesterase CpdA
VSSGLTVLHVSDFQCGKPFVQEAADAMLRVAQAVSPDVVVVAGDLTQRAKAREYEMARRVLDAFGAVPLVVTPGNHDVPLYRIWERVGQPFRNWRAFVGRDELDTVTRVDGATVVALSSAAPHAAVVNGRLHARQVDFARRSFAEIAPDDFRILVVHHHFAPVPTGEGGHPIPGAAGLADAFREMGVDVVLGGHVHQLHLRTYRGLPFLSTGTATSRRGRGVETGWNSLCVHRITRGHIEVTPYRRGPDASDFESMDTLAFELRSSDSGSGSSIR